MLQRFEFTETLIFNQNIKVLNVATWFIIFPQYRDIKEKSKDVEKYDAVPTLAS